MWSDRESFRYLCSAQNVLCGPYADDEIQAWLEGIRWCRDVMGVSEPIVVRAYDDDDAEWKLRKLNKS